MYGGFPSQIARQPRGCQYGTVRLQKALGEVFPTPSFLAPVLLIVFQLLLAVEIRSWKLGPGECDIPHRRIRYSVDIITRNTRGKPAVRTGTLSFTCAHAYVRPCSRMCLFFFVRLVLAGTSGRPYVRPPSRSVVRERVGK